MEPQAILALVILVVLVIIVVVALAYHPAAATTHRKAEEIETLSAKELLQRKMAKRQTPSPQSSMVPLSRNQLSPSTNSSGDKDLWAVIDKLRAERCLKKPVE